MESVPTGEFAMVSVALTKNQLRDLNTAAEREHRTIHEFVLNAALKAAAQDQETVSERRAKTQEEVKAIVRRAQAEVRKHIPPGISLADELIAERRLEAIRELE